MNTEEIIVLSPWHRTRGGSARHIIDAHLSLYRLGAVKVERQIMIKLLLFKGSSARSHQKPRSSGCFSCRSKPMQYDHWPWLLTMASLVDSCDLGSDLWSPTPWLIDLGWFWHFRKGLKKEAIFYYYWRPPPRNAMQVLFPIFAFPYLGTAG